MDKTLQEIKQAEIDAVKIIDNAQKKASQIIADTSSKNEEMQKKIKDGIQQRKEQELKLRMKAIEQEKSEKIKKTKQDMVSIENKAKKNLNKSIKMIIDEYKKMI